MKPKISLITLGVADLARAMRFYAGWGWSAHPASQPGVTFYQMNGAVLALFGQADLAADPDGHVRDIAHDPVWPLQPAGSLPQRLHACGCGG